MMKDEVTISNNINIDDEDDTNFLDFMALRTIKDPPTIISEVQ